MKDKKLYVALIIVGLLVIFGPAFVYFDNFILEITPKNNPDTRMRITNFTLSEGNELIFSAYLKQEQESKLLLVGERIQSEIKIINSLELQEKYSIVEIDYDVSEENLYKKYDINFSPTVEGHHKVILVGEHPDTILEHSFFGTLDKQYPQPQPKLILTLMLILGLVYFPLALFVIGSIRLIRKMENRFHIFRKICNPLNLNGPPYLGGLILLFVFHTVGIAIGIISVILTGKFYFNNFLFPLDTLNFIALLPFEIIRSFFKLPYSFEYEYSIMVRPYAFLIANLFLFIVGTLIQETIKKYSRNSITPKTN